MPDNGLRAYGFHADEDSAKARAIQPPRAAEELSKATSSADSADRALEKVAHQYLSNAFESDELPSLTLAGLEERTPQFSAVAIDDSPIKETQTVKFLQSLNGIPVYGSLVTVEVRAGGELVTIDSAIGDPRDVSSAATLSPAEAVETLHRCLNAQGPADSTLPRLSYYYEQEEQRWRLVYIFEDIFCARDSFPDENSIPPVLFADFVIDATSPQLVEVLPRISAATGTGVDAMGQPRRFQTNLDLVSAAQQLQNVTLNIHTRDFAFQDVAGRFNNLPGGYVKAPPLPWNPIAVSAHANSEVVADFLLRALGRRGLDGRGGPMVSSINCVWAAMGGNGRNWPNSFWIKDQVVFGQRQTGPNIHSFATALDMVAHEFFHGVTQFSSRLDLKGQTGALNESYSDIFGVIIANGPNPNWSTWRWDLGADTGAPLRDFRQPSRPPFGHPEHMSRYQNLPLSTDFGGIHINCGIHNKAAFNIMNSRDPQGQYLFTPAVLAQIFYHALIALGPTAAFSDSRRVVDLQARTILRGDPRLSLKLNAIASGFSSVGI